MVVIEGNPSGIGVSTRSFEREGLGSAAPRRTPRGVQDLRSRVQVPIRDLWRPPAPPLALDTPLMMPDLETLARVLVALHKL